MPPRFLKPRSRLVKPGMSFKKFQRPFAFAGRVFALKPWGYERGSRHLGIQECFADGRQSMFLAIASHEPMSKSVKLPGVKNAKAWAIEVSEKIRGISSSEGIVARWFVSLIEERARAAQIKFLITSPSILKNPKLWPSMGFKPVDVTGKTYFVKHLK